MPYFASYLHRVNFCHRNSLGLSGVVSLILSGCSRFALSSVCVGSPVVLGFLPFVGSFVCGFSPPAGILMFAVPTYSFFLILIFYCYSITVVCLFSRSLHPTQAEPPPSPTSTLALDFVHVSFIVVPVIPSPHCPLSTPPCPLLDCS